MNPAVVSDRAALAGLRRREFHAACDALGASERDVLCFPDGLLTWFEVEPLIAWLSACLRSWRPDVVITFGRDGLYWHPDHIALGERVRTSVAQCAREVPVAAYAVVMPPDAMVAVATATTRDVAGVAPAFWGVAPEIFGKGALPATRIVDVAPALGAKLAALQSHASQLDATNPLSHLTVPLAAPLALEHFHLLETSPLHRSALDLLAR
jgi:LmbE family N-acetylglucosaminyl deacetylase